MTDFATLTLTRQMKCPPERLFELMTDRESRQAWGAPSASDAVIIDSFDLRPGGQERARCGPQEAPDYNTITDFHVISAPSLLVSTETLVIGGETMSVSLCTSEVAADGPGSRLTVTLQITSLVGDEMFAEYKGGWTGAMDNLARLAGAALPA